jgi:hypothetical protein
MRGNCFLIKGDEADENTGCYLIDAAFHDLHALGTMHALCALSSMIEIRGKKDLLGIHNFCENPASFPSQV